MFNIEGKITYTKNNRTISLLSDLYKLLAKIITNHPTNKLEFHQPRVCTGCIHETLIRKCTEYKIDPNEIV